MSPKITLACLLPVFTIFLVLPLCSSCRLYLLTSVSLTISVLSQIAVYFHTEHSYCIQTNKQQLFVIRSSLFPVPTIGEKKRDKQNKDYLSKVTGQFEFTVKLVKRKAAVVGSDFKPWLCKKNTFFFLRQPLWFVESCLFS